MLFMFCFLRISLSMAEGFISDVWFLFLGTSLEVFVLAFIIISLTVFIFTLMSLCESLDRFSATESSSVSLLYLVQFVIMRLAAPSIFVELLMVNCISSWSDLDIPGITFQLVMFGAPIVFRVRSMIDGLQPVRCHVGVLP